MTTEIKYKVMKYDMYRTMSFLHELQFDYDSMEAATAEIEEYCKTNNVDVANFLVWPIIRYRKNAE